MSTCLRRRRCPYSPRPTHVASLWHGAIRSDALIPPRIGILDSSQKAFVIISCLHDSKLRNNNYSVGPPYMRHVSAFRSVFFTGGGRGEVSGQPLQRYGYPPRRCPSTPELEHIQVTNSYSSLAATESSASPGAPSARPRIGAPHFEVTPPRICESVIFLCPVSATVCTHAFQESQFEYREV